ncbi:hypothetical protein HY639_03775 [Candidatus Woesearchaeota archaeon]|nr:hypothetical protein [Candidatus Woesearchaeota archaeon]
MIEELLKLPGAEKLAVASIIAGAISGYCDAKGIPIGTLDPLVRYGPTVAPIAKGCLESLPYWGSKYALLHPLWGVGYGTIGAGATMFGYGLGHAAARVFG